MFVHDRQFFTVDPARSLYNVTATYASNMVANSILTVINAGIFMLLMYALIGARLLPLGFRGQGHGCADLVRVAESTASAGCASLGQRCFARRNLWHAAEAALACAELCAWSLHACFQLHRALHKALNDPFSEFYSHE